MTQSKHLLSLRTSAYCGILSPIITFTLIGLAIYVSPWWSWTENALSDLGVEGTNALLFNSGLIIGGIPFFLFALSVRQLFHKQVIGQIGAYLLMLTTIFMVAIGIFPEPAPYRLHFIVSVGFFVALPFALLFLAIAMLQTSAERKLGAFTLLIAVIAIVPWGVPNPWRGVAIPELISALAGTSWSITMSIRMLHEPEPSEKTPNSSLA